MVEGGDGGGDGGTNYDDDIISVGPGPENGKSCTLVVLLGCTCKYLQLHKVEGAGGPQSQNLSPNLSPYLLKLWKFSSHL